VRVGLPEEVFDPVIVVDAVIDDVRLGVIDAVREGVPDVVLLLLAVCVGESVIVVEGVIDDVGVCVGLLPCVELGV
jgi:hypothetical protein